MIRIDSSKLEEVLRNIGVVFVSTGFLGFVLDYSLIESFVAIFLGIFIIYFGIKESDNGN